MRKIYFSLLAVLIFLFANLFANGQLTGAKNIPGDYANLAAAITDLNTQGVGAGGVTLNLIAANPQTAPAGGYVIGGTGSAVLGTSSSSNPVIIQGNGNTITASASLTVAALNDAIFKLVGADWITLTGFIMEENSSNTTTAAASNNMTEWGVALLYFTATNGCQNITIQSNTIDLNRIYQNTFGIYSNSTHTATTISTSATATGAAGGNSGLKIYGNTITDVNNGIVVVGPTAAADYNDGVDIGGSGAATANTITNYGTTGTFSTYANVSATVNGILIRNAINYNISYNTITSSNGGITAGTANGIQIPAFTVAPTGTFSNAINNNILSVKSGIGSGAINGINSLGTSASVTSSLSISNNNFTDCGHTVAGSGAIILINQAGTHQFQDITGNTFTNLSVNTTGSVSFIVNTNSPTAAGAIKNVNNNSIVTGFSKTGGGGTVLGFSDNGIDGNGVAGNCINNVFTNVTLTGATIFTGISYTNGSTTAPNKTVSGNTVANITGGTGTVTGITVNFDAASSMVTGNFINNITNGAAINGISTGTSGVGTVSISQNIIHTLAGSGTGAVAGISIAGAANSTKNAYGNKIYNLSNSNAAGSTSGIAVASGTTIRIYNNLIGNLTAPAANAANAVYGINITSATTTSSVNVSYNTIYLQATSSGTNFGTSGIFHTTSATATTANLTLRNNIIINKSTPNGTGIAAAYRRSSATLTNYNAASDNNLFYGGAPSSSNLIYYDGTNSFSDITAYKSFISGIGADQNSETEDVTFQSTTGSSANFLKYDITAVSKAEAGAENITGITDDYAGTVRQGNPGYTGTAIKPDIGAWELEGAQPSCSGMPVASNTVASPNPACAGQNLSLSLDQVYLGVTYQWQSSSNNITYSDIGGAISPTYLTTASVTAWYQCIITCAGNDRISTPLQVVVNPPLNGTYTINNLMPTGGANYNSFGDAVAALICRGINGPVVFNVQLGTSYNEQVIIPAINGSSAANTITFNGNAAGVTYLSAATTERAVIKINGADYVTINNLTITAQGSATAEFGYGVQLVNNADNNTINNCIINITTTPTTAASTNFAGIVINTASATTPTGTGDSQCDNNTISGNTISGGYLGVSVIANGNTNMVNNNKVINNTITDFYEYGVYFNGNDQGLIEGNVVSRPARSSLTTFRGISLNGFNSNSKINANKVHTPFGAATSNTSAAFGIYINACRTTAGNENIVSNNMVYNFVNGSAGNPNHNGALVVASDHVRFYYNSILLDDASSTCTTCGTRGFYMQTAPFAGLEFKNNIVRISRAGTGPKQAIYFEGTGVTFTSDYNDLYIESTGGTIQTVFANGTGYANLADWKGTGQDLNSWDVDPMFISPSDLHLQSNSPLDDKGTPAAGVTTDIDGETRDAGSPDIGADELPLSSGIDMKAAELVSPAVTNGCYGTETITVKIKNNSITAIDFTVNPVTVTVNVTGAATASYSALINSGTLASGATMDVTMTAPSGTLNMIAAGTYFFNASTSVAGDVNAGNNAMPVAERLKVALTAGTVLVSPDDYCVTGGTPTLTVTDADGYTAIQWQQSATSGSGFTDIVGANTSPYTVGSAITQTMYYRLVASCGVSAQTSTEVSVLLINPQVLTTAPGARCGPGTVNIGATNSTGATLNWYENATGGTVIGTGNTFTTPVISNTTTYYVAAAAGSNVLTAGRLAQASTTTLGASPRGIQFNATREVKLLSVKVFSSAAAAGSGTIELHNASGTVIAGPVAVSWAGGGTTANPVPYVLDLNFDIPVGTGHRLLMTTFTGGNISYETTGITGTWPNYSSAGGEIELTASLTSATAVSTTTYYYFYDWQVSIGCESPRMPVIATVTLPPAITASATSTTVCANQPTQLNVSSANAGYIYVWNPGNLAGATPTVSPATSTTYTVTATDNSGGPNHGCVNTATVNITANPVPSATMVTPSSGTFCTGAPAQLLTANGGAIDNQLDFGIQANQNIASTTITGFPAPYTVYYGGQRMQMLVTAAELSAAGFTAGSSINNIQFPVVSMGTNWGGVTTACIDFQVSMGHTALASISAFQSGLTQVVSPANFTPAVGYGNTHVFSTPFIWNGTSNIILETTFSNNKLGATADLVTQYNSPTGFQSTIVYRADNVTSAAAAAATTVTFSYSARPDFKFNGTTFANITWSPTTNLYTDGSATIPYTGLPATSVYVLPVSGQTYTATATNSFNCTSSGSATVTIVAAPSATISYGGSPYCSNAGTATVTQTGTTGGVYSSAAGLSINSSTGAVNIGATTTGTYTVTYTIAAANGCSQFQTTASITIAAAPSAVISYAGSPYCTGGGMAAVSFSGTTGGSFSSTAGLVINNTTGAIDLAASTVGTYTVTYTIAAGICPLYEATTSVTISTSPSATISYTGSPYCSNGTTASVTQTGSTGGTYSSTAGLSINAATGEVNIAASIAGTYTVTYSIGAAGGCSAFQTTANISITVAPSATISYTGSPYCTNGGTATVTQTGTTGGAYSSTAGLSVNSSTGAVNLGASTAGTYTVTYTVAAANGCAQFQTTASISITAAPAATISYAGSPYCSNGSPAIVSRTGTAGGTYSSTTGLSINSSTGAVDIGASTPGTYTVTYTVAPVNGCAQFQTTAGITITAAPAATISYGAAPYCSNGGTATVTHTGTTGGTYSSTTGLSVNSSTGAVNLGASTPGTYTVTYTVTAANGCAQFQATASITINAAYSATISYAGSPYCGNAGTATVTQTGNTGGAYSSTAGLSINSTTGAVNLNASTAGAYTVTYTLAAANGCAQFQATTSITITPAPAATISYAGSPYCSSAGSANVTLTGTTGGTFTSTAGLSINTSTGAVNAGASTAGTYTVTYTVAAANGCAQFQTTTSVTITAAPAATISYAGSPFCITAGTANVTSTGTTGGTFSSTAGLSINAATGAVNLGAGTPGTYTVTYTIAAAGGCAQLQATAAITIAAAGTWMGTVSSDWNTAANWCGGIPTPATDVLIPSSAPNMPGLTGANGTARNISISNGATMTIGAGGILDLYGNITGTGSFNSTAGNISFRGTTPQAAPGFTANNVTMNGAGGVTQGGNTTITGTLFLFNGNISLGNNNLTLNNSSAGSSSSHIITNGTGHVVAANLAASQARTIPVGSDAGSYNPAILTANTGHTADNFTVRVQQGVFENGVSGATYTTHVANRMWIINESTVGGSNVNVTLQWNGSQELTGFDRTRCYVMQHNGTSWVQGTATTATGADPYTQTRLNVTSFSPFAVETQRIPTPATGIYPNPAPDYLNVVTNLLSTGPVVFSVYDTKGRLVYKRQEVMNVGLNQTTLDLRNLAGGVYILRVSTRLNHEFMVQRFVKGN